MAWSLGAKCWQCPHQLEYISSIHADLLSLSDGRTLFAVKAVDPRGWGVVEGTNLAPRGGGGDREGGEGEEEGEKSEARPLKTYQHVQCSYLIHSSKPGSQT